MKFEDAVLEIKRRVDLVQVVGQYVNLKKSNHGFTGLCPFHSEKTPSFHVRPDKGYFKCFGCDAAGDVFTFLEKQTGQLFWDIVQKLAGENQVIIDDDSNKQNADQHRHKKTLLDCLLKAQEYFQAELQNSKINSSVLNYLIQSRRFSEEQIKQRKLGFGGFNDDGLLQFLQNNNVLLDDAIEVGLINQSETGLYSAFKQRITVPIFNHKGQLVGFGGRIFSEGTQYLAKYINSKASQIYDKGSVLFGLFESLPALKQNKNVVLSEGYFDVMAVQDVGIACAAVCGTSLTKDHVSLLGRYTNEVTLCLDQDLAGQKAHYKMLRLLLESGFQVRTAILTEKDPDALWRSGQKQELQKILMNAPDAIEVLLNKVKEKSKAGVASRIAAMKALIPYLQAHPSMLVKRQYIRLAARILEEDEGMLLFEVLNISEKKIAKPVFANVRVKKVEKRQSEPVIVWSEAEKLLLRALLVHPQIIFKQDLEVLQLNQELKSFLISLQSDFLKDVEKSPETILQNVKVENGTTVVAILLESTRYPNWINLEGAQKILNSFFVRNAQRAQREELIERQNRLILAEQKGDYDQLSQILSAQAAALQNYRDTYAKAKSTELIEDRKEPDVELKQENRIDRHEAVHSVIAIENAIEDEDWT